MGPLERVKLLLAALPREDQEDLHRYLSKELFAPLQAETSHVASLAEGEGRAQVTFTYRTERVRCGKPGCACRKGPGHGPYVYKYWKEDGRLRKRYVGKAASSMPRGAGPTGAPTGRGRIGE